MCDQRAFSTRFTPETLGSSDPAVYGAFCFIFFVSIVIQIIHTQAPSTINVLLTAKSQTDEFRVANVGSRMVFRARTVAGFSSSVEAIRLNQYRIFVFVCVRYPASRQVYIR